MLLLTISMQQKPAHFFYKGQRASGLLFKGHRSSTAGRIVVSLEPLDPFPCKSVTAASESHTSSTSEAPSRLLCQGLKSCDRGVPPCQQTLKPSFMFCFPPSASTSRYTLQVCAGSHQLGLTAALVFNRCFSEQAEHLPREPSAGWFYPWPWWPGEEVGAHPEEVQHCPLSHQPHLSL